MRAFMAGIGALALISASAVAASATSLQVAPTTIDMTAPDSASVLNLRNDAKKPVTVQVRVFRWSQKNGVEKLEPTTNVVASPPSTKLSPNQDYVVRILRVGKAPVAGEESYRVLVDELPVKSEAREGTVNLVVRHSIPVFFRDAEASKPQVTWTVERSGKGVVLKARNEGDSRLRIADLQATQGGKAVATRKGLVGYVLGGSTMTFPLGAKSVPSGAVLIKATSDLGKFDAKAAVKGL
jgi:fimbrial chaperone protein